MHSRALYTGCSYFTLIAETWPFCSISSQHFSLHHLTVDWCGLFTNVVGIPPPRVPKPCCKRDSVVHRNASGSQISLLTDATDDYTGVSLYGKHHMRPAQVYMHRRQSATTSPTKLLSTRQTHINTITHACLESFLFTCLTFQATCFTGGVGGWTVVKQIMLFSKVQENRACVLAPLQLTGGQ